MITAAQLLNRAKQEYLEMPGLVLTTHQASRLWGLDPGVSEALLAALVREGFLAQTHDGSYLRSSSDRVRGRASGPEIARAAK